MSDLPEADWKVFRKIHAAALQRFFASVLDEAQQLTSIPGRRPHVQYLKLYKLIEKRDRELADAFNDYRRSTALGQMAKIQCLGVVAEEELLAFSERTRERLENIRQINEG